ncbi:MAG: glycogen debranching enzyme, partial [Verrucomicrobia bacterium]|nr:glycogen debranching enzyme [Verrucomicrobiota bacterium]
DPPPHPGTLSPVGLEGAIIYELHIGSFTKHRSAGVQYPGTFRGLKEKIPYLQKLGVTHVELLPVMAFDVQDVPPAVASRGLSNFWGYSTHSFFSPHPHYCIAPERGTHQSEFRDLVDSLHDAGLRVLLDVVLNHTAEGGAAGTVINFKGLAREAFYQLDPADRSRYLDFSGCGNTVNCNHPVVTRFLVNCLEWWVEEMGVDGFRFDLASVFARGEDGQPLANPPFPWSIELSRTLARLPLIAEAWDAGGLYQVGNFPGLSWTEWNGKYRDVMRRFVRGDRGIIGQVATCLGGSSDLYANEDRLPCNSVNFITCHDGFTLRDLVSYNYKRNEANGEDNRDGNNDNLSWNCGTEGETTDPTIVSLRLRQAKNLIALLMLSRGVPMLLAGDELWRTQQGNNNVWCQDNEISWINWQLTDLNLNLFDFVRGIIAFRRGHPSLVRNAFYTGEKIPGRDIPDISWFGPHLNQPGWNDPEAQFLAFTIAGLTTAEPDLHVGLNMSDTVQTMQLPNIAERTWHEVVDTADTQSCGIVPWDRPSKSQTGPCNVQPRSLVVFEGRASTG